MSRLQIKFPRHLTVKLSQNNFYQHKISCKLENMLKNIQLNSLFNNPIKKSFFYVLLRLLSFPKNLQYSIICQSNFVFIQQSIICEKHLPFYIFALLEVNQIFLSNYYPSKSAYH